MRAVHVSDVVHAQVVRDEHLPLLRLPERRQQLLRTGAVGRLQDVWLTEQAPDRGQLDLASEKLACLQIWWDNTCS